MHAYCTVMRTASSEPCCAVKHMQALSAVGRCRSFDAAGDGYGRGEGFAVAVLCPTGSAAAMPYSPLGLLCGSAVNQVTHHDLWVEKIDVQNYSKPAFASALR